MRQGVVITGASDFGREILDVFEADNEKRKAWEILGFIDDDPRLCGQRIRGYPVLGGVDWFSKPEAEDVRTVIAVGDNRVRRKIAEKAANCGANFCNIIHPSVIMTRHVDLKEGVIIAAGCIFTNNIIIQDHVIINLDVTVGHDTIVERFVNLNPGVHINGNNKILEGAYLGSGAVTIQNVTIGKWSIVGAGAVVVKDIPERVVAVGVPARPVRQIDPE